MPRVIQCCPKSPITGGMHQVPSKYCREHVHLDECKKRKHDQVNACSDMKDDNKKMKTMNDTYKEGKDSPGTSQPVENNSTVEVSLPEYKNLNQDILAATQNLPANDDDTILVGCKEKGNVDRFYTRTTGILALVRPCGIFVDYTEMFTCESSSQAFTFLLRFCSWNWNRFQYIGYDRACELHPFLKNLKKGGNVAADEMLNHLKFLVDIFHCLKHKKSTCMPLENNPKCKYHPRLPTFKDIHGANTECAEQSFKWLSKFKHNVRRMTMWRYRFYMWTIINTRNEYILRELRKKKRLR